MQEQVNKIEQDIKEIKAALIGNEFNEGIIADVNKNSAHRKSAAKTNGFIAGASILFGGLLGKIWDLI